MFKAMSEASDEFMRAPQFQDMMKQSLSASIHPANSSTISSAASTTSFREHRGRMWTN